VKLFVHVYVTIGQFTYSKLESHAGLRKLSRWITKIRHSKHSFAFSAH